MYVCWGLEERITFSMVDFWKVKLELDIHKRKNKFVFFSTVHICTCICTVV